VTNTIPIIEIPLPGLGRCRSPIPQPVPMTATPAHAHAARRIRPGLAGKPQIKLANMKSMRLRRAEAARCSCRAPGGRLRRERGNIAGAGYSPVRAVRHQAWWT